MTMSQELEDEARIPPELLQAMMDTARAEIMRSLDLYEFEFAPVRTAVPAPHELYEGG